MAIRIEMFGFKSGAGYQLNKHDERLFDRYNLRNEKNKKSSGINNDTDRVSFSEELEKAMCKVKKA